MTGAVPRLADVHCTRINFEPGSRLLVRSRQPLDSASRRRLHRTIQKWAGDHVNILIIDPNLEIEIERPTIVKT